MIDSRRNWQLASILIFTLSVWAITLIAFTYPYIIDQLGLVPRDTTRWWGIVTMAFVHGDMAHLIANTAPLLVLLFLLQVRCSDTFLGLWFSSMVLAGVLLWACGRSGLHIGASGLVFALFGIHIANGIFNRTLIDVLIAIVVGFAYWGMLAGVLPTQSGVSWEGHLLGLIAGIVCSWLFRKRTQQPEEIPG